MRIVVALLLLLVLVLGCSLPQLEAVEERAGRVRSVAGRARAVVLASPVPAPIKAGLAGVLSLVGMVALGVERIAHGVRSRRLARKREGEYDVLSRAVDSAAPHARSSVAVRVSDLLARSGLSLDDLREAHHRSMLRRAVAGV